MSIITDAVLELIRERYNIVNFYTDCNLMFRKNTVSVTCDTYNIEVAYAYSANQVICLTLHDDDSDKMSTSISALRSANCNLDIINMSPTHRPFVHKLMNKYYEKECTNVLLIHDQNFITKTKKNLDAYVKLINKVHRMCNQGRKVSDIINIKKVIQK